MKRIISTILAVLFMLTILPCAVFGAEGPYEVLPEKQIPDAYIGVEYNERMAMLTPSILKYDDIHTDGELPKGLEIACEVQEFTSPYDVSYSYTFYLKGTPTEKGFFKFVLSATDSWGEHQYPFLINVTDLYSPLAYATEGTEYTETLLSPEEAAIITQKEGTHLPEGIELVQDVADGKREVMLKGTPKEAGDFFVNLDVTVREETKNYFFKLTVNAKEIQLVTGYEKEVFKDELFAYPNAEYKTEDTLPKGLELLQVVKKVGDTEANAFVLSGIPEEQGEYEFSVTFKAGEKTVLTQKYLVKVKGKIPQPTYEGSLVYNTEDRAVLFTVKKPVINCKVYGNLPKGLSFKVSDKTPNNEYECAVAGIPEEHMLQKYIFEVEVQTEGHQAERKLCVLYVAESRKEIGPLPMYYAPEVPLTAMLGGDIEGLQSMELLLPISNVTLEKAESGEYKLQITYPIDGKLYLLPVLVKYTDKDTNKTVETIVQYRVVITENIIGDSNLDGKVDTADAVQILKYVAGMVQSNIHFSWTAEANGDGIINTADAVHILKYVAGIIEEL